jgi:signal transduction histidine kinase
MVSLLDELREISRGVHPAILSEAGLGSALKSLARRAALPVELNVQVPGRLPEPVEVAAYYVVGETLANAAKYSGASAVEVAVTIDGGVLRVCIRDDGCGGADPARGSGIVGLRDRAEALGGRMTLSSPPGKGTSIVVEIPLSQPPTDTPVASVGPAPPSGC